MFGVIFTTLLFIQGILLFRYVKILGKISTISVDAQKVLGLTVLESNLTSYFLLKDIKFFLCLLTKSYAEKEVSDRIKDLLNQARVYLLLQYPVVLLLFFTPIVFRT
jgi:hypothetical protein